MTRRRLPIGMQTLREIRERDCYYVDKTAYIGRLLDEGKHYFLSRPRRFGKSLFLDTCKELFEGNEGLFEGLAIHEQWDWSVRHPVLRLSFGSGNFKEPGHLPATVMAQLDAVERETGVVSGYASASDRFGHMLDALHRQAGRPVAVLVDEYDKPILDALETPEVARANRDFLCGLYATIKDSNLLSTFDVDSIAPEALLFQTGYLTVQATESRGGRTRYRLGYPNREVFQSLNESLLAYLTRDPQRERNGDRLYDLLMAGDVPALKDLFHAFFASIPYEWYTNNDIARFEGYYASVFYAYFAAALGTGISVEDSGTRGRADMAVRAGGRVYLFEFKVAEQAGPGAALEQLRTKGYADKYRALGEPVHLVGVEFSSASRNVVAFDHELA